MVVLGGGVRQSMLRAGGPIRIAALRKLIMLIPTHNTDRSLATSNA